MLISMAMQFSLQMTHLCTVALLQILISGDSVSSSSQDGMRMLLVSVVSLQTILLGKLVEFYMVADRQMQTNSSNTQSWSGR